MGFPQKSYDDHFENFHWIIFFNKYQIARLPEEASSFYTPPDQYIQQQNEYPAAGALMYASPAYNFEQYGFKDGINYLRCDAANYARAARDFLRDEKRTGEIADAGRKLVEEKFHADVYVRFTAEAFERIRNGTYRGAHLENGDWLFD